MNILFVTNNLTPDLSQLAAWLLTEGLAWFLSASPAQLAIGVWGVSWGLAGVLLAGMMAMGRRLK